MNRDKLGNTLGFVSVVPLVNPSSNLKRPDPREAVRFCSDVRYVSEDVGLAGWVGTILAPTTREYASALYDGYGGVAAYFNNMNYIGTRTLPHRGTVWYCGTNVEGVIRDTS